jgi:integrase
MEDSIMGVIVRQKEKGKGEPWYVFINHQGKRTARKFSTKAVAKAAGLEIERLLVSGEFGRAPKIIPAFGEYSKKWFENYVRGLRESTQDEYESILRVHILPVFGRKPIDSLNRGEIRDFLLNKFNGGLSKTRTLMIKDLIGSVLRYALDDELISANPVAGLSKKLFPKNSGKAKPITEAQIEKLLAACKAMYPDYYLFFMVLCKTGSRLGECIALRWGDIDHEKGVIWIRQSYRRGRITPPKNGNERKVRMSAQLAEALKAQLAQLPKDIDALISDYDGYYLTQNQARRIYQQI